MNLFYFSSESSDFSQEDRWDVELMALRRWLAQDRLAPTRDSTASASSSSTPLDAHELEETDEEMDDEADEEDHSLMQTRRRPPWDHGRRSARSRTRSRERESDEARNRRLRAEAADARNNRHRPWRHNPSPGGVRCTSSRVSAERVVEPMCPVEPASTACNTDATPGDRGNIQLSYLVLMEGLTLASTHGIV